MLGVRHSFETHKPDTTVKEVDSIRREPQRKSRFPNPTRADQRHKSVCGKELHPKRDFAFTPNK